MSYFSPLFPLNLCQISMTRAEIFTVASYLQSQHMLQISVRLNVPGLRSVFERGEAAYWPVYLKNNACFSFLRLLRRRCRGKSVALCAEIILNLYGVYYAAFLQSYVTNRPMRVTVTQSLKKGDMERFIDENEDENDLLKNFLAETAIGEQIAINHV